MRGTYWHNDDFLFELQFPPTDEKPKDSRAADEFLERFLRRRRLQSPFTRCPQLQPAPVVSISLRAKILQAFKYLTGSD
jgi:hypothetical protein